MKSTRITSLSELYSAAKSGRSVVGWREDPKSEHPKPAAWVLSMQGSRIVWMLANGLYLYVPKGSKFPKKGIK